MKKEYINPRMEAVIFDSTNSTNLTISDQAIAGSEGAGVNQLPKVSIGELTK